MNNQLPDHQGSERLKTQSVWPTLAIMTAIWMALSFYSNERVLTPQVLANLATQSGGMTMTPDQAIAFERMESLSYGFLPVMLVLCSQSIFRFADLGDDGLCRGGPDKGCGVIVSGIDVVVDRLD